MGRVSVESAKASTTDLLATGLEVATVTDTSVIITWFTGSTTEVDTYGFPLPVAAGTTLQIGLVDLTDTDRRARGTQDGTVALVDRGWRETGSVASSGSSSVFAGFRFPREVIAVAVRWYLRYGLSYRDVEELLAERGVTVDHVTIYRWVQRFTPEFIEAARPCRHAPGDRWFVDETYVKVAGRWTYLYRAVDQHGQVIDVLLSITA